MNPDDSKKIAKDTFEKAWNDPQMYHASKQYTAPFGPSGANKPSNSSPDTDPQLVKILDKLVVDQGKIVKILDMIADRLISIEDTLGDAALKAAFERNKENRDV
jgi:hypothetical protein